MTKVTLVKGSREERVYHDAEPAVAERRANHFADLYGADAVKDECGNWWVDARPYFSSVKVGA